MEMMDKTFKEGLQDHRIEPSNAVWARVESSLNQKEEKKGFYWYVAIAAALVILFAFSALIRWNTGTDIQAPIDQIVEQPTEEVIEDEEAEKLNIDPIEKEVPKPMIAQSATEETIVTEEWTPEFQESISLTLKNVNDIPVRYAYGEPQLDNYFLYDLASLQGHYTLYEDPQFGEQVLTYTKDQLKNWANGEPIELPKPKFKKPKLDVDWNKLFASGD
jgi:hypothetical protein